MSEFGEQRAVSPPVWQSGLVLAAVAAVCTALVAVTYGLARPRIMENERAHLEQSLSAALDGIAYDRDLTESRTVFAPPHALPGSDEAEMYRVFAGGTVVAALFAVTAEEGFAGPIRVLVGIASDGRITGVRILRHKETPGIGDYIEQTRSDWVYQFDGRSLGSPGLERWAIKSDGGDFDQLTSASVTPRAVVKAITETLIYFEKNRETILASPAHDNTEANQ